VKGVSGTLLARRAERVAEIMGRTQPKAPAMGARRLSALGARLATLLSFRGRGTTPGLLLAALVGMAISSGSSRALLRGTPSPATAVQQTTHRPPQIVPNPPPSIVPLSQAPQPQPQPGLAKITAPPSPAARVDSGPRAEAPPRAAVVDDAEADEPLLEDAPKVFTVEGDARLRAEDSRQRPATRSAADVRRRALARVVLLNSKAMDAYQRAKFESARGLLRNALAACASGHLQQHPVAAATHAYLGVVLVGGFQQSEMGVEQFRQALRIDRNVPLSRRWAKPAVAAAFRQAVART